MIAGIATPAHAQDTQPPAANQAPAQTEEEVANEDTDQDTKVVGASSTKPKAGEEKVIVTGTSIRNAPPTGTNLIAIDKEGIKATGANSGAELLSNIPQVGGNFFNGVPQLEGQSITASNGAVLKPNARGIPGNSATDSGSSTLILLDGQRVAGTGTLNNAADVNTMPVALLERVEVNTDGGSSIYGSDSIGGVVNFITRRRFDGIQVRGRYGIADDYHNYEVGGIVGHTFGRANAYISYSRTGNDDFLNRDRDFYQPIDWDTGLEVGLNCALPNVRYGSGATARYYGVDANGNVSPVAGTAEHPVTAGGIQSPNLCSPEGLASFTGKQVRNNALASFSYDFTDDVKLTIRGRYADSSNEGTRSLFTQSATLTQGVNPTYRPIPGETGPQTVLFTLEPALDLDAHYTRRTVKQYGISPELTVNIDDNWQVRSFFNWERSRTHNEGNDIDNTTYNAALLSGALDPYNVASADPALIADIIDSVLINEGENEIMNARVTADGALFELPGGKVRMAIGAEYMHDKFGIRDNNVGGVVVDVDEQEFFSAARDVKSLFGEINIPVVSSLNSGPLFEELRFAFSARYDKYSDFGDNFSPRIGMTYSPFKWLRFRGNWGKSFRAPTTVETLQSQNANASRFPSFGASAASGFSLATLADPARPSNNPAGETVVLYFGVPSPGLKPQTGTNWSVAGEIRPIDGLRAELSYYKIDYRNAIGFPPFLQTAFYPAFANLTDVYPCGQVPGSCPALEEFLSVATNKEQIIADLNSSGQILYATIDGRTSNFGSSKLEGLDYSARYDFNTPIGAAYVSANGNVQLVSKTKQFAISAPFDNLAIGTPNHRTSVNVGLRNGGLRTQLTLNHTDGYKVTRSATLHQDSVGSYDVLNAFVSYEFTDGELGLGSFSDGLELSLNVQNVFDDAPPIFRQDGSPGFTNGNTLGRLIQIGIRKDFSL
jgi:iron complex outermembrane receptor protein